MNEITLKFATLLPNYVANIPVNTGVSDATDSGITFPMGYASEQFNFSGHAVKPYLIIDMTWEY